MSRVQVNICYSPSTPPHTRLNFHINHQSRDVFWKWQMKIKTLKIAPAGFTVCIRWSTFHSPFFFFFHKLKSFNMFNCAGDERRRMFHIIFAFSLHKKQRRERETEWHTLVSFDCLMFFFEMCLMTAMWACRNAFAALQWNTERCQSGCETTLRHDSDRNFPSPHYQHQTSWVIAITSAQMLRATGFFSFPSETGRYYEWPHCGSVEVSVCAVL